MSQFNYGRTVAASKRLINRFGDNATIVVSVDTPNVDEWKPATRTDVSTDVIAVFLDYDEEFINGTTIRKDDQKVLFNASVTFAPNLVGYITRQVGDITERWNILNVKPLNPGGTIIMYTVQVRK